MMRWSISQRACDQDPP